MSKLLVETKGPFFLMGSRLDLADRVQHERPCVVLATSYIETKAAEGVLLIIRNDLPQEANDVDWAAHYAECEGDLELAIESYLSTLPSPAEPEAEPEAKTGKGRTKGA